MYRHITARFLNAKMSELALNEPQLPPTSELTAGLYIPASKCIYGIRYIWLFYRLIIKSWQFLIFLKNSFCPQELAFRELFNFYLLYIESLYFTCITNIHLWVKIWVFSCISKTFGSWSGYSVPILNFLMIFKVSLEGDRIPQWKHNLKKFSSFKS